MQIICKFRSIDKNLLDSLARGYIYFSHPEQLNDPFDCQLNIVESLNRAIERTNGEEKEKLMSLNAGQKGFEKLNADLSNTGVFSCSHNMGNIQSLRQPLLWSHYADSHKGVCLIYNIPDEYIMKLENGIAGVPIHYKTNSLFDFFIEWASSEEKISHKNFIDSLAIRILSSKDTCWSYENEYRLLSNSSGEFQLDRSFLKHVCYGLNTSDNDTELISNMLVNFGYESTLLKMKRVNDDFGIIEEEI